MWLFLLMTVLPLPSLSSHVYYFTPTNKITHEENWLNKDKLCIDDKIIFEESENTVAYIDNNLLVNGMILPKDGILYFKDGVTLGLPGHMQCSKRKSPEDVYFDPKYAFAAWYHPLNWEHDHDPILHMNFVPGSDDEVNFLNHSIQMYIEYPPRIATLTYSGRQWSALDFENLLYTVEGQFKVSLGHEIGRKVVVGDVELNLPLRQKPIYIEKPESNYWNDKFGAVNGNSDPKVMSIICSYIECNKTEGFCVDPIRPFGHCCDICGAYVNFSMIDGNRELIWGHLYENFLKQDLHKHMRMTMERMDPDAAPLEFQVSLFPAIPKDGEPEVVRFNEEKYLEAVKMIGKVLDSHIGGVAITAINHISVVSKVERRVTGLARTFGFIVGGLLVLGIVLFVIKRDTDIPGRILSFTRQQPTSDVGLTIITWHRGESGDEDVVTIDNPTYTHFDKELASEEENPPLEEPQPSSSTPAAVEDPSVLVDLPVKEGNEQSGDMEMTLIEL